MPFAPPVMSTTLPFNRRSTPYSRAGCCDWDLLATKIEKSAVQRIVHACEERCFVGAKIQSERGDFTRVRHSADRLRLRKFDEHFFLAAGIMLAQIAVDERSVYSRGRNAIAADVAREIILRDRIRH